MTTTCPSAMAARRSSVVRSVDSFKNRIDPSASANCTPPGCMLPGYAQLSSTPRCRLGRAPQLLLHLFSPLPQIVGSMPMWTQARYAHAEHRPLVHAVPSKLVVV